MNDEAPAEQPDTLEEQEPESKEGTKSLDDGLPDWVVLPKDFKPPPGRIISFLRFRAQWTDTPHKGDRQCIIWNLTDADERVALKRAQTNDAMSIVNEFAKQCVRAVDGVKVNWAAPKGKGSIDEFWRDIGSKCRSQVATWYTRNHQLTQVELADFFENCVAVRTSG